jgi:putative MATE family efflux protein
MQPKVHFISHERHFYLTLISLALPIILQNLISVGVGVADNVMVGSLGETAISGVAMANQVQNMMQQLVTGVSAAIILLASQYWGKHDTVMIKRVVAIGFKFCLTVGLAASITVLLFPEQVLRVFTNDMDVVVEGAKYLRIIGFSYVFFCLTNVFIASMRCVETVHIALIISISTLFVDVGLNYVLIFGHFGFPRLGIRGAAIATLIARILESCIITVYVRFIDRKLRFRFKDLLGTHRLLLKDFIHYGTPVILGDILWGIGGVAQASIIGRLGDSAIAANSIALTVFNFISVAVYGLGGAAGVIIGKTVGAAMYDKVKEYTRTLQIVFVCVAIATSLALFGLRDFFISLYQIPDATKLLARQFISILCITVLGTGYHVPCFTGIIRAGGDTKFVLTVDFIFVWFVVMPLSLLAAFVFHASPVVVFFCIKCDQLMKWVIAIIKTNNYSWMKNLTREA